MVGPQRQRPAVAGERLLQMSERLQRAATIAVSGYGIGVESQGGVDLGNRRGMLAALVMHHAEQMQAVEMVGLVLQNSPIADLGLDQPAAAMQRHRLVERCSEVEIRDRSAVLLR